MACASSAAGLKNVSVGQSNGSRVSEPGMMQDSRTLGFLQQCAVCFSVMVPDVVPAEPTMQTRFCRRRTASITGD